MFSLQDFFIDDGISIYSFISPSDPSTEKSKLE